MKNQSTNPAKTGEGQLTLPAETGTANEPVQISPPHNEDMQTGPFEHSGETSRQTEEARVEEADRKAEE